MVVHIIEDDEAVADALALALEHLDHSIRIYLDGETFMAQAHVSDNDWVIVDLGLPGISGAEIVRDLKRLAVPPKIIAISGKSRIKILQSVKELPDLTILRKPLSVDMLTAAMA
ncbi:response regulator [uncultured Roseibium sp.]|uniref:response regulator n=1 Tax=uncultured Roseibium sp. TaxID=1936171 RepID=UPI002632C890|nr:response regulator [uncultured Roseibium sp.]